ncbi:hypothetical protein IJV79_02770, partial [bacterium]|nr:hypothetical protein [bacterium]
MLLQGDLTSNKTDIIIEKYAQLLNSGVKSSEILVLLQNKNKRQLFEEKTLKKLTLDAVEKFQIHSFQGLVYNTILNNWATIENSISNISNTQILPNLAGLQISQYIIRNILNNVEFKGYNSRKSLLHPMFRRYSLIVQNNLSPQDVKWRSEDVLKESFAPDAKFALDEFKKETLNLRCLDYLRQTLIFNFIYKNTDYFKNINYLLLDDGDEITPVCYDFIEHLKPQLKDWIIAYDKLGSTRVGYLSADKTAPNEFEKLFQDAPTILTSPSKLQSDAQTLFSNVLNNSNDKLSSFVFSSYLTRGEMLKLEQVKALLKQGIKPCEIVIISPIIDSTLNFCINENLSKLCTPVSICGNEKLVNDSIVAFYLNVLKCAEET